MTVKKFDILIHYLLLRSHTIKYPDREGNGVTIFDKSTELLSVMTVCRHGHYNGSWPILQIMGKHDATSFCSMGSFH